MEFPDAFEYDPQLPSLAWISAILALWILAILLNVYALSVVFRCRMSPQTKGKSLYPVVLPLVCELIKCVVIVVGDTTMGISHRLPSLGPASCQTIGFGSQIGFSMSSSAITTITMDRYAVVTGKVLVPPHMMLAGFGATLASAVGLALIPLFVGSGYLPRPSRLYCMLDWTSRQPPDLAINMTLCVVILAIVGFIAYYQVAIYRFTPLVVQTGSSEAERQKPAGSNSSVVPDSEDAKLLFFRFYALSTIACAEWGPILLIFLSEAISGNHVSFAVDTFGSFATVSSSVLFALCQIWFTPMIRSTIVSKPRSS